MKEYETYLFDLDNTVADSSPGLTIALKAGFKEYGIPYDPNRYGEYVTTPLSETWAKYKPECPCKFRDFMSIVIGTYDRCYTDAVSIFPDAKECIDELHSRGKKLGIVSNSLTHHITSILDKFGILDEFDAVTGADSCQYAKPDPQPILLTLKNLNADPSTSVMIGDGKYDIKAGKRAGTDTILIVRGHADNESEPDETVTDLREILTPFHLS